MDIQNKEALIAEIEQFKEEALKMHIVQVLADSYTNTNLFDYNIDSDGSVIWYKAQARQLWDFWQAKAVPEGFVLMPIEPTRELLSEVARAACNQHGSAEHIYKALIKEAQEQKA